MKSKVKQMLSVILTVCMLTTVLPLNAYASDADFGDSAETDVTVDTDEETDLDISEEAETVDESIDIEENQSDSYLDTEDENIENIENIENTETEETFSAEDENDEFSDDAVGAETFNYVTSDKKVSLPEEYMKIFHLDAGRKYFSVNQIEEIIDMLASNGYNYMELAVGNDALRFILDDMSVTVGDKNYSSADVKAGIQAGNKNYYNAGTVNELSQGDMDTIFAYAAEKGISIIPLLNSPGHMDAIIDCMEFVGMSSVAYNNSARTIDVSNASAVNFTTALIQKYAGYFSAKGCKVFNLGADEYANDVSNGFASLIGSGKYGYFVKYVNSIASIVKDAGMVPMAFNDGIYYAGNTSGGTFDSDIAVSYWTSGWGSGSAAYSPASASFLAARGHKIINTRDNWYYVLGRQAGNSSGYTIATAMNGVTNIKYNEVAGAGNLTPVGSMICVWCDAPSASYNDSEKGNLSNLITTFVSKNPEVFSTPTATPTPGETEKPTITPPAPDNGEVKTKTITLRVGETYTDTINGVNYTGKEFMPNPSSVAKVEVTDGSDGKAAETTYSEATVSYSDLLSSNASSWKKCGNYYYTQDGENYYPLYAKRSKSGNKYEYTWGYELDGSYKPIGTENTRWPSYAAPSIKVYTQNSTEAEEAFTKLTFTGLALGTAYVQIGDIDYTIQVVDTPDNALTATSINLEYWITNYEVYETTSKTGHTKAITTNTAGAASEEGIAISSIAPEMAYSFFDGTKTVYYWQAMRLDKDNQQTNDSGDDETADGTTLTHVRYYNGAWQYKTLNNTWNYFESTDQLVAYYLQKTEVTKEVDTYSKDWGYSTDDTTPNTSSSKGQVALTVAVVYPNGTVSPTETEMYAKSTTIFNYWDGRDIGIVAPQNNSDYNISKITVTDGKRDSNLSANVWYTSDSITWDKTTDDYGNEWYNETEVWNKASGTTPMVNGKDSIIWSEKNKAKLVLIYLEPVEKKTNLNVKYVDDSEGGKDIAHYQISMTHKEGEAEPTFLNGTLVQKSGVHVGEFTLDDGAYVINSKNEKDTFNKNLATVAKSQPITDVKYLSGSYKYVRAEISEDGKTLILHYTIDGSKVQIGYVLDFGEKVNVPLADLVENPDNVTRIEAISDNITVEGTTVTYVPKKVLEGIEIATVRIVFSSESSEIKQIAFMPATTVYYEETFVNGGDGAAHLGTQEAEQPGSAVNNYGYDASYADGNNTSINLQGKPQSFEFKGTGVGIYANTAASTGTMMIMVKEGNSYKKIVAVDTKMANGTSNTLGNQEVSGTNVPVATLDMKKNATYSVELSCVKSGSAGMKPVYFDGFRVYNTLENDGGVYAKDNEANPSYYELRDQVLNSVTIDPRESQYASQIAKNTLSQVYASDGVDKTNAIVISKDNYTNLNGQDLLDNGPKNELYLQPNQSAVFSLSKDAQIGLKGVNGAASYSVTNASIQGHDTDIVSTTDMFYRITQGSGIIITNTSKTNILSITRIKVCGNISAQSLFTPLTEESLTAALVGLGYEKEPEAVETPSVTNTVTPTVAPTAKPAQSVKPATKPGKVTVKTPVLRKAKRLSKKKAVISWKKVNGANGYVVYRKTNKGKWKVVKKITKGNITSFTDKKLSKGKKYTYTVRAYRTVGGKNIYSGYNKKGLTIK